MFAPVGAAAATPTPLTFVRFTVGLEGRRVANEYVNVEAQFRNRGIRTVRAGRFQVFLVRKATTRPSGRPFLDAKLNAVAPERVAIQIAGGRLRDREGRYRVVACLDSPGYARRCSVLPGSLMVAGIAGEQLA